MHADGAFLSGEIRVFAGAYERTDSKLPGQCHESMITPFSQGEGDQFAPGGGSHNRPTLCIEAASKDVARGWGQFPL